MSNGNGILRGGPPVPFVIDETRLKERFEFTLQFAGSILPASPATAAALTGIPVDQLSGRQVVWAGVLLLMERLPAELRKEFSRAICNTSRRATSSEVNAAKPQ
jgi:hypothetical protein